MQAPVRLALGALAVTSPVTAGCDLLPQSETEWTIALVATGVLVVGAIVAAWVLSKKD